MAWQDQFQDHGIRALEEWLGLPVDGVFDPTLDNRVRGYQALLGHKNPGELSDMGEYNNLVQALQARITSMRPADSVPMQDTAFQAFMRNAGAEEASILDEIRYRTEQNSREINRRAAGFAAEKEETGKEFDQRMRAKTADFTGRGFIADGTSAEQMQQAELGEQRGAALGGIDQQQMEFEAGQNDALSAARRQLMGDVQGIYRKRADEELAARDRIGRQAAEAVYGG